LARGTPRRSATGLIISRKPGTGGHHMQNLKVSIVGESTQRYNSSVIIGRQAGIWLMRSCLQNYQLTHLFPIFFFFFSRLSLSLLTLLRSIIPLSYTSTTSPTHRPILGTRRCRDPWVLSRDPRGPETARKGAPPNTLQSVHEYNKQGGCKSFEVWSAKRRKCVDESW
jgi:hypothetical protein